MFTMRINPVVEQRTRQSPVAQWWDLFLMELTNWRWSWRMTLITGSLAPLFLIILLGVFADHQARSDLAYMLTGNMVIGLLLGTMTRIINRVEFLRFGGGLDFFATLPVQRFLFSLCHDRLFPCFLVTLLVDYVDRRRMVAGPTAGVAPIAPARHPALHDSIGRHRRLPGVDWAQLGRGFILGLGCFATLLRFGTGHDPAGSPAGRLALAGLS